MLPIAGSAVKKSGYTWYPVAQNGVIYYVRGDCVEVVASLDGNTGTVATATPTAVPVTMGYIRTTVGGVNLRLQPAGNTIPVSYTHLDVYKRQKSNVYPAGITGACQ